MNILIADDHGTILEGLAHIIAKTYPDSTILKCKSPTEVLDSIQQQVYDLYILDLEYKDLSGIQLIKAIRADFPDANIIVHTLHDEHWTIMELIEHKVDGVVFKQSDTTHLLAAIKSVAQGGCYFCDLFKKGKSEVDSRPLVKLSAKEIEALQLAANGLTVSRVSELDGTPVATIESRRRSVIHKLGVENITGAVLIALRLGYLVK